eukprot:896674-Amphidinium_carterae.1
MCTRRDVPILSLLIRLLLREDILKRIVDNPSEPKYRAPTKQKVETKLGARGLDLLRALGFIDNGDKLVLPETVASDALEEAYAENIAYQYRSRRNKSFGTNEQNKKKKQKPI